MLPDGGTNFPVLYVSCVGAGTASYMVGTFRRVQADLTVTHMVFVLVWGEGIFLYSPVNSPYPSFHIPPLEILVQSAYLSHTTKPPQY